MAAKDFIIELGCAELPPKALRTLSRAFQEGILAGLKEAGLSGTDSRVFATPRRLAVMVKDVPLRQEDSTVEKFGPALKAAYDEKGQVTRAAEGFARSCGVAVSELQTAEKDGAEKLVYRAEKKGRDAADLIPGIVNQSLAKLPIPKKMRWGSKREEFVRPVYWVLMLLGEELIEGEVLGIASGHITHAHRFHHPDPIRIESAAQYEDALYAGHVIADHDLRKERIREQINVLGEQYKAEVVIEEDLLEEVTSLVEWPVALIGRFDEHFLDVPAEALISSMKSHQKCFYLIDERTKLLPYFITVSNIESKDPEQVITGNERVIRPRLADAAFFFESDARKSLESQRERLKNIVFQKELGTVFDKSQRVAKLAAWIAEQCDSDVELARRAGELAKCDLLTLMVSEFPELQGIMAYYYALNDGEPEELALALNEQYQPRFAGDKLPSTDTGAILSIAEKLDTIVGLFAIGQPPTGSKDPFALRRASLGVLRILVEKEMDLDLQQCIAQAGNAFSGIGDTDPEQRNEQVFGFMLDRFRAWYQSEGVSADVFQSVFALRPSRPLDFSRRIHAVHHFCELPESEALAASNKRVANILQNETGAGEQAVKPELFREEAEKVLASKLGELEASVLPLFDAGDYREGLAKLAASKDSIDRFFDEVMVMDEDPATRSNRLALLAQLRSLFLRGADISHLHRSQ